MLHTELLDTFIQDSYCNCDEPWYCESVENCNKCKVDFEQNLAKVIDEQIALSKLEDVLKGTK